MAFQTTPITFEELAERAFTEMREAERAAEQAKRRRDRMKVETVLPDLRVRYPKEVLTEPFVNSILDKHAGTDPYWKSKAGANRWHIDQATMYAGLAQVAAELDRRTQEWAGRFEVQTPPLQATKKDGAKAPVDHEPTKT